MHQPGADGERGKAPPSISQAPPEACAGRQNRDRHRITPIIANPRRVGAIWGARARVSALSGELRRGERTARVLSCGTLIKSFYSIPSSVNLFRRVQRTCTVVSRTASQRRIIYMWGGIIGLIIQLISGAVGGNIAGSALKQYNLGTLGNSIAGVIGGGVGAQIIGAVVGGGAGADVAGAGGLDIGSIIGQIVSGGVGGGILMVIVGLIKQAMGGQPAS